MMDLAQNSLAAGAGLITVEVEENGDSLTITVADDGKGMSEEQLERAADPFFTTRDTRKVGLGLPLFKMAAEMTGGGMTIRSRSGRGTAVTARFVTSHVDMIPLGDINATVFLLITCNPDRDFLFRRTVGGQSFALDTRELRSALGEEVPLNAPEVADWIRTYLLEQTTAIKGGKI